jgi:hypothetical protein
MPHHIKIKRRNAPHLGPSPGRVEIAIAEHALVGDDRRRVGDAVLERHFHDPVHPPLIDRMPVAGAVDERVTFQRVRIRNAKEVLHFGDTCVFIG